MSSDQPGTNTLVPYMYRDRDNYKAHAEAVFAGVITDAEREAIVAALSQAEFKVGLDFEPSEVDLEDARELDVRWTGVWDDEVDHSLNELLYEDITVTALEPTDERTISEFVAALVALNNPDGDTVTIDEPSPRRCFFIPIDGYVEGKGFVPSLVVEDEAGHAPLSGSGAFAQPYFWGGTYEEATAHAAAENAKLGLTPDDVTEIILSSMRASAPSNTKEGAE